MIPNFLLFSTCKWRRLVDKLAIAWGNNPPKLLSLRARWIKLVALTKEGGLVLRLFGVGERMLRWTIGKSGWVGSASKASRSVSFPAWGEPETKHEKKKQCRWHYQSHLVIRKCQPPDFVSVDANLAVAFQLNPSICKWGQFYFKIFI